MCNAFGKITTTLTIAEQSFDLENERVNVVTRNDGL